MSAGKKGTCCFAGERRLPKERIEGIVKRLNDEVDFLIRQGVTDFISGGIPGFDQIAASLIVTKRAKESGIRLVFALPYRGQDGLWDAEQRRLYRELLGEADEIVYVSEEYSDGCVKKRNRYMAERSAYCLCAWPRSHAGAGRTASFAKGKGVKIIDVSE